MATDAYLAGLFDGEGCVSMSLTKNNCMAITVKVSMCDRAPVAALHARFGGEFSDGKQKTPHGRSVFSWMVYNADTVEALEVFLQHCLVKCVVAQAALPCAKSMAENKVRGVLSQAEKASRIAAAQVIANINKPVGQRRILDAKAVAEYMRPKTMGGSKQVRLSDGRAFSSVGAAAQALGVSISAVSLAKRKGTKTAGVTVEAVWQ
jgi:hypothetical protein